MKVIAINGSPRKDGNTWSALETACKVLNEQGIETEIVNVGNMNITGCKACGACSGKGACVINDGFNEVAEKAAAADGIIVGSPVYYAGVNGTLKCFLDRFFYVHSSKMRFKPAAAVVALRRSGVTHTYHLDGTRILSEEYGNKDGFKITCCKCGKEGWIVPTHHLDKTPTDFSVKIFFARNFVAAVQRTQIMEKGMVLECLESQFE